MVTKTNANVTKSTETKSNTADGWLNVSLKVGDTNKKIGQSGIALDASKPADKFLMERYKADPEAVLAKLNDNDYLHYSINITTGDEGDLFDKIAESSAL